MNSKRDWIEHVTIQATCQNNARMKAGLWALFLGYPKSNKTITGSSQWMYGWHRFYNLHWECQLSKGCKLFIWRKNVQN